MLGLRRSASVRPQAELWEDAVTMALATYTLVCLYWDGILHNNRVRIDSFLSGAHVGLYLGLMAIGAWIAVVILKRQDLRKLDVSLIPHGYGVAFVALPLAAIGGPADFIWHKIYGFENQTDAPFSPTHQTLFLAGALLAAIGVRSAWRRPGSAPGLRALLPAIASMTLIVAMILFVFQHVVPFFTGVAPTSAFQKDISRFPDAYAPGTSVHHVEGLARAIGDYQDRAFPYYFFSTEATVAGMMLTTAVLIGAVLYLRRRWVLPFGTVTIMWTFIGLMMAMLTQFRRAELIPVLVISGLVTDLLLQRIVGAGRPRARFMRTVAGAAPVVLWGTYFLFVEVFEGGLGWGPSLWIGVLTTSAGVGFGVAMLLFPAPVPGPPATAQEA